MTALRQNIDARQAFTQTLLPANKRGLSAYEAEKALFGIAYKKSGMPTHEDCVELLDRINKVYGHTYSDAVLSRFGLWKLSELFIGMRHDFFLYCQSILVYGANPFYGWTLNDIRDRVRSRWLMWHPGRDELKEFRGTHGAFNAAASIIGFEDISEMEDVTGNLEFERRLIESREQEEEL